MHSSQDCLNSCQQLVEGEGFCDVVVGADPEAAEFVVLFSAGGQNDNAGSRMLAVEGSTHLETVESGQCEVKKHEIRIESLVLFQRGDSVVRQCDVKPFIDEVIEQDSRQ